MGRSRVKEQERADQRLTPYLPLQMHQVRWFFPVALTALFFGLLGSFVRAWGEWLVEVGYLRVILSRNTRPNRLTVGSAVSTFLQGEDVEFRYRPGACDLPCRRGAEESVGGQRRAGVV